MSDSAQSQMVFVFSTMLGATLKSIDGGVGDERMVFKSTDGRLFTFYYEHDCCASCSVNDVVGDLDDLIGSPLVVAEAVSNEGTPPPPNADSYSYTWTFYRFATVKGTVTISWLGESNGYYNESVTFAEEKAHAS